MTAEPTLSLDDIREAHAAIKPGNWMLDDCEDDLQIWRESALERVTRDETGEITGYSTPSSFQAVDLIARWDVETWDEGESFTDDEFRRVARFMVAAFNQMPALLAEVEDRLPLGDVDRFLRRERDAFEDRGLCWHAVDSVLDGLRLHVVTGTPLTEPRPEGGPEAFGVGKEPLTEAEELRAEVKRLNAAAEKHDHDIDEVMTERDEYHDLLDAFALSVAPMEVIGEHSSGNDPWANALELLTSDAEVRRLRGAVDLLSRELQREGIDVTEVLAENQRMREALYRVFAELLPEGRIGRTLLHGSYPTAANVGRHECLDAISAVLPQTAPATMPESAPAESSSPTEEKE